MSRLTPLLVVILAISSSVICGPSDPAPRPDQWWMDRHNQYLQNTNTNGDNINVLFYGDSITEGWGGNGQVTYNEFYAPLGTANYGIGGDQTQHLLWRMLNGEIDGLAPKVGVLKIGTNNLGGATDEDIATGVIDIVMLLRERLPNMKLLLLGVLPRNNAQLTARTDNINAIISHLDDGDMIRFHNMRDVFYRDDLGFDIALYTADLLHLSGPGYAAWANSMNPLFFEMLNSSSTVADEKIYF